MATATMNEFYFPSATKNGEIYAVEHVPEGEVRAVVQVTHGMAEHIRRYDRLAKALNDRGIVACGIDFAGHKGSLDHGGTRGYFGESDGWSANVADMRTLYLREKEKYPHVPYILFGHSMGSFAARTYASRHGDDMDAFIFSGTAGKNPVLWLAKLIGRSQRKKLGSKTPCEMLDKLSFGSYNKAFSPNRTGFDWLSRDNDEVDKYVADEFCGFVFSTAAFCDLFNGLCEIAGKAWAAKVPKKPILMVAGGRDPVGSFSKGVVEVRDNLIATGHDVELHIYEGARHEILNETNRDEVTRDILAFIEKHI